MFENVNNMSILSIYSSVKRITKYEKYDFTVIEIYLNN